MIKNIYTIIILLIKKYIVISHVFIVSLIGTIISTYIYNYYLLQCCYGRSLQKYVESYLCDKEITIWREKSRKCLSYIFVF